MKFDASIHHRRSIRLGSYDYSRAAGYFVTICTYNRECVLGEIDAVRHSLSEAGSTVLSQWAALPQRFPTVSQDLYVIMPNHVHGIIFINTLPANIGGSVVGAPLAAPQAAQPLPKHPPTKKTGAASGAPTLGQIVRAFKSLSTVAVNRSLHQSGRPLWQRNYWERIIRNETELHSLREYIANNLAQWELDSLYTATSRYPGQS